MQLVIEAADYRRLSQETRDELRAVLEGRALEPRTSKSKSNPALGWRRPFDLTPDLARKLVHGLEEDHVKRLTLFAKGDGRVALSKLLALTGETDLRALSHFEGVITRKLRRLIGDEEKKATLIGWDYDSTQWSGDGWRIVDGIYYVTEPTARSLAAVAGRRRARV
ncbi:MAG: hypothetical protein EXQ94_06780 [Alphaproteobacteria bacterium]|nr:hypothetical protein [Alphaproteobacteria bacterium]